MKVYVKEFGKITEFNVSEDITITDFKKEIEKSMKVPIEYQILKFNENFLFEKTLKENGIKEDELNITLECLPFNQINCCKI